MNKIFVDTSGWGNLIDSLQEYHSESGLIFEDSQQRGIRLLTTNFVIAELVALLTSPIRMPRRHIIDAITGIKRSHLIDILHISESVDAKSWDLLSNRIDKNWSLVDCSSFVVMGDHGITDALTSDHHFEQAGFVRLLK